MSSASQRVRTKPGGSTWGNALYEVGDWDVQPFGFAGGLYDPLTKLVHFGAREYDAVTERPCRLVLAQG